MLFTEGTKVRFINTGDTGVITQILNDDMVNVLLDDDDMEIPTYLENLERLQDTPASHRTPVKAKFIQTPQPNVNTPPPLEGDTQYHILKSLGIQLAFDPVLLPDGRTSKYHIFLINDTRYDALFTFVLTIKGTEKYRLNGKISSTSFAELGELYFDQLNDAPVADIDCWQVTTQGTGKQLSKKLKIKAQQFFKNTKTAPLLNRPVHHYVLFENFDNNKPSSIENLQAYTQRNAKKPKISSSNYRKVSGNHPNELAEFKNEIDLHIENLKSGTQKLSNAEILRIQLNHFDAYLAKAIRLGVNSIFVIHGLGKGKLRNEIATRLMKNPDVKTFKNEYHPKYGFGATEVIL